VAIHIVRLGSPRLPDEGLRIGTVRYPPRGVSKADLGRDDFYDVWFPTLAPSAQLLREARASLATGGWKGFARRFKSEMKRPDASRALDLLTALSRSTNLSVGCYCADESRCHRSLLRESLTDRGAILAV
jgi:uncharacterized protein YeaO (DUF488 family)